MACKHFQQKSHNFNIHAKFTVTDQLTNTFKSKETLTQQLIEREYDASESFNMGLSKK